MTRTFATLVVSKQTFEEISEKLRAAGYDHVFLPSHDTIGIDMNGIVLQGIRAELESKKSPKKCGRCGSDSITSDGVCGTCGYH